MRNSQYSTKRANRCWQRICDSPSLRFGRDLRNTGTDCLPTPREWIRDTGLPPFATLIRASAGPRSVGPQCRQLGITTKARGPCSPIRLREHCYRLWSGTIKRLRFQIANVPAFLLAAFNYRLGPCARRDACVSHKDVCRPNSRPSFTCLPAPFHRFHFPQPPPLFALRMEQVSGGTGEQVKKGSAAAKGGLPSPWPDPSALSLAPHPSPVYSGAAGD